jgi:uncharacterized protein YndB with AHSA1/START domain
LVITVATVAGSILIRRPVEVVFDYVADQTNEPRYNPQMTESTKLTAGPVRVGTRYHARLRSGHRPVEMTIEVTGYRRPVLLASKTTMSSADVVGSVSFDPVPAGTRMRWSWRIRPHGLARLAGPLVGYLGRRQERRIWSGLKRLLETAA